MDTWFVESYDKINKLFGVEKTLINVLIFSYKVGPVTGSHAHTRQKKSVCMYTYILYNTYIYREKYCLG